MAQTTSETESTGSLPRNVQLLGVASLMNDVASEMIYPLLPQFLLSVLGGTRWQLGVIEGVAESVSSLLKLGAGAWSDRAGERKSFVVAGYALAAVSRPWLGVVSAPWQVFCSRIADRIGKGLRTAPRDALIAESTLPAARGRAFGFHRAMDHLGAAIGPILASLFLLVWPEGLRTLFLLTLIPGLTVVVLLAVGLRETTAAESSGPGVSSAATDAERTHGAGTTGSGSGEAGGLQRELAGVGAGAGERRRPFDRNFQLYLLSLVVFTLGNSSDAFLLVRAGELGVPTAMLPLLWCAFHLVKSGGNLLAGRAVDRLGPRPLIVMGWLVYAAIYLAFALVDSAWLVWLVFLIYGVFYALTEPAEKTLVATLAGPERKGLAFGWFNAAIGIAALPSSLLFGWIYEQHGAFAAFGWGASLSLVAAGLLLLVSTEGGADRKQPA